MAPKQAIVHTLAIAFLFSNALSATLTQPPAEPPAQAPAKPVPTTGPPPLSDIPIVQAPPHKGRSRVPTNVTWILEKAGGFSVFIRLLKSTEVLTQVENQLSASNSLTILAAGNDAFAAGLKPGQLNELTNEQKVQLMQYHVLPTFISLDKFQTLSNPVRTQASNSYDYPMNVTSEGNWVNISTGLVNASISATVFADDQLAIYRVDKLLKPFGVFAPLPKLPPAPAPVAKAASANVPAAASEDDGGTGSSKSGGSVGVGGSGVNVVSACVVVIMVELFLV